jgi:hypothetical protein
MERVPTGKDARVGRKKPTPPYDFPDEAKLHELIQPALGGDGVMDSRRFIIVELLVRITYNRHESAVKSNTSHWFQRSAAGATAGVAALTGGTLLGNLTGATAKIIGAIAAVIGLLSAAIIAARPGDSFATDLVRKAQYEQLIWELRAYAVSGAAQDTEDHFRSEIDGYAARLAAIENLTETAERK